MSTPMQFLLLALLTNVFHLSNSRHVHNECRNQKFERCFCGKAFYLLKEHFVVNCTDQGFTDASMLSELPEETEALIFTGNNITTLPWNIFGDIKELSMLKIIDMSNNNIRDIKGKTYHHVPNVETLILNHNNLIVSDSYDENHHHPRVFSNFVNLRELHLTNAFADNTAGEMAEDLHDIFVNSNLTYLFKIHLEQNEIRYFKDPNVFCDLPSLRHLYLGNNYLPNVNFNVRCLNLQFLDLEKNNITRLTEDDLDAFDSLTLPTKKENFTVDLRGNPLTCATASKLYNWLLTTNVTLRRKEELQCESTKAGKKHLVSLTDLTEFKHAKRSKAVTVLLVVLVLILISLVSAYAYMHKEKIRTRMSPLLNAVTRKVQYTTIDSQIV